MRFLTIILLEICFVTWSIAMYFNLGAQEEKCIIEEIPEDTLVTGKNSEKSSLSVSFF